MSETYKEAGVDIRKADELVKHLGIEGFGALINLGNICLVLSTDGVGTKLLVAEELKKYDTIGIDLVAMCVNDVLCHGALPLAFLDYYATGKLNLEKSKEILSGIQRGCEIAGCKLVGGETAEMPGLYEGEHFDLAGFCVGAVARRNSDYLYIIPRDDIKPGDVLIGIPSSGPHSNGFSLIRKLYKDNNLEYDKMCLEPTRIYVDDLSDNWQFIKAAAHITGGGIHGNLPRVLPSYCDYKLHDNFDVPVRRLSWWKELYYMSKLNKYEFESIFNCGWGMILVVDKISVDQLVDLEDAEVIGEITER
jgi:phosphoribosylformylglycinamidine cyclo-ligase